jgi:hypothetical protein
MSEGPQEIQIFIGLCEAMPVGGVARMQAVPVTVHRYDGCYMALWNNPPSADDLGLEFEQLADLVKFLGGRPFEFRKVRP